MRIGVILICVIALIGPAHAGEQDSAFRSGLAAFNAGQYAHALAAWGPLATAGDARAQEGLGYMYYSGRGVERDTRHAAQYFYLAANQGDPTAQLFLALMHFTSDGVPRSAPLAMMWSELAMDGGQDDAYEIRGQIMQSMTPAERAEGWRLVAGWQAIHAKMTTDK
jgi:TPR repeat protein